MKYKFVWTETHTFSTEINAADENDARVRFWNGHFEDLKLEHKEINEIIELAEIGCVKCENKTLRLIKHQNDWYCFLCLQKYIWKVKSA
jgi:hypothetical protein